jgi:predicted Zn finger-like uncharacterized protein
MLITCPSCAARYDIDAQTIGASGRKVRCAACKTQWLATPQDSLDDLLTSFDVPARDPEPAPAPGTTVETLAEVPASATPDEPLPDTGPASPPAKTPRRVKWTSEKTAKARQANPGKPRKPMPKLFWPLALPAALALCLGGAVWQRNAVVAALPATAPLFAAAGVPVNLRGIAISEVVSRLMDDGETRLLVVDGSLTNITDRRIDIPRLRFAVLNGAGREIYAWTAPADRAALEPGESQRFRRRLASPPAEGQDVLVRFVTRSDMVAGLR